VMTRELASSAAEATAVATPVGEGDPPVAGAGFDDGTEIVRILVWRTTRSRTSGDGVVGPLEVGWERSDKPATVRPPIKSAVIEAARAILVLFFMSRIIESTPELQISARLEFS
jgi:hypothetical protein